MRIVTWNCSTGFANGKFKQLEKLHADVYVIQEYTIPNGRYDGFSSNKLRAQYLDDWIKFSTNMCIDTDTHSQNKRLYHIAVFAKPSVTLTPLECSNDGLQLFCPVKINDKITLIAYHGNPNIGALDMYCYTKIYADRLRRSNNIFICGDFNDHPQWDTKNPSQNFSGLVDNMNQAGLKSYYHLSYNEPHGAETNYTYYAHRQESKGYHIDYFFGPPANLINCTLGKYADWCKPQKLGGYSDHTPLIIDIAD